MAATIYEVPIGKNSTSDYLLTTDEVNALGELPDILGAGPFTASDFTIAAGAGLSVTIGAGLSRNRAIVGSAAGRKLALRTSTDTYDNGGSGLPASQASVYIYLKDDGTYTHNTTGSVPAGAILLGIATTDGSGVTAVNNTPIGRTNLSQRTQRLVTGSVSVNPASIAAGATGEVTLTISGVAVGDMVMFNIPSALEAGLAFAGARVSATDTVVLRLANVTGGAIDGAALTWTYAVLDLT